MIPVNGQPAPVADEFAAGLEVEVPVQVAVPAPVAPVVDPIATWAREQFENLPEDLTGDAFADHITSVHEENAGYKAKVAEYEQRIQQMALAQPAVPAVPATPVTPVAEAVAERQRRFNIAQIDAQLVPFLAADYAERDAQGYYKPKTMIPQVIQACDAKNRSIQEEGRIAAALTGDFYGAVEDGVYHSASYQALLKEVNDLKANFSTSMAPLQKSAQELEHERFLFQNQSVLYTTDATGQLVLSAAGEQFNDLTGSGTPREKAIEFVKKYAPAPAPVVATPVAAAPAVATPVPAAPKAPAPRFTDAIRRRANATPSAPAERRPANPQEGIGRSFRTTWEEVKEQVMAAGEQ